MKDENAHMLADNVYDAFFLIPLYLGMYYKADLHIHGKMSKKLYRNAMNYLQRILCDFSDDLSRIDVKVEGFANVEGEQSIIGTGISCGVDSLTTIYDRYVLEDDPEYRVNGLFFFNYGSCGDYGDAARKLWLERYTLNNSAADELGLPVYRVDSNLHAFTHAYKGGGQKMGYFANYSCILGLGGAVKRHYTSSCFSYKQILSFGTKYRDFDFAEFSESYSVPLIRTERTEIVIDGCQYERSQKTEHIADWDIAQKYLNVCVAPVDGAHNCSKCSKCMRALIVIDALGKLEKFADVFNIDVYNRHSLEKKCRIVLDKDTDAYYNDMYFFAKSHGMHLPSRFTASLYFLAHRISSFTKKAARKLMSQKLYSGLKHFLKR